MKMDSRVWCESEERVWESYRVGFMEISSREVNRIDRWLSSILSSSLLLIESSSNFLMSLAFREVSKLFITWHISRTNPKSQRICRFYIQLLITPINYEYAYKILNDLILFLSKMTHQSYMMKTTSTIMQWTIFFFGINYSSSSYYSYSPDSRQKTRLKFVISTQLQWIYLMKKVSFRFESKNLRST